MKKRILYWVLMATLTLLLAGPQAMAQGKDKKGDAGTPSGWEKGEKKGWEGDVPPKHDKKATEAITEEAAGEAEALDKEAKGKAKKAKKEGKKKGKKSKERAEEEGKDAEKSVEKEREKATETEEE
jgi:hypothetical protein